MLVWAVAQPSARHSSRMMKRALTNFVFVQARLSVRDTLREGAATPHSKEIYGPPELQCSTVHPVQDVKHQNVVLENHSSPMHLALSGSSLPLIAEMTVSPVWRVCLD